MLHKNIFLDRRGTFLFLNINMHKKNVKRKYEIKYNIDIKIKESLNNFVTLNNIELDTITIKTPTIEEIYIRFNNKICLNQDNNYKFICSNKIVENEDYCL